MSQWPVGVVLENLKMGFFQAIKEAARIGADIVQPHFEHSDLHLLNADEAARRDAAKQIRDLGLEISSVCILPKEDDYKTADNMRNAVSSWLDVARDLDTSIILSRFIGVAGPNVVTIFGPTTPPPFDVVEAMRPVIDKAADMGISLAHETGLEPPEDVAAFIDAFDSPGIGVNYDPANLCMFGYDWIAGVDVIAHRIVHVHAKDARRSSEKSFQEMPLGQGQVDYDRFLPELKKVGFKGCLAIERESIGDPIAEMTQALAFLREKMKNLK